MKNILFLSISLLLIICCQTADSDQIQRNNSIKLDATRKIDKEHSGLPPGTLWIKDSIYMDQREIRNLDYLEYTNWLKRYDSANYAKALPDSTVWQDKLFYNEPYVHYYFTHPAYRDYPLVGVSYEQAVAFCEWRTTRVKDFIRLKKPNNTIEAIFGVKDFHYRLPTKEEWEYAAHAGNDLPYGYHSLQARNNTPNFNLKEAAALGYENNDVTIPTSAKRPNAFGMYNMIGNLAEMISEKGVCKGGSWKDAISDCEIGDSLLYDKPSSWLGFRCVCILTK
ncbi:MAG TPA: SUMF1/EgtB/PvdO family nonheme iron enzyme [Bacteroidia bacterium]|jgi:formylglycine-generating enzyme required for sulfatase activity